MTAHLPVNKVSVRVTANPAKLITPSRNTSGQFMTRSAGNPMRNPPLTMQMGIGRSSAGETCARDAAKPRNNALDNVAKLKAMMPSLYPKMRSEISMGPSLAIVRKCPQWVAYRRTAEIGKRTFDTRRERTLESRSAFSLCIRASARCRAGRHGLPSADRYTGLQVRWPNDRQRRLGHDQFDP